MEHCRVSTQPKTFAAEYAEHAEHAEKPKLSPLIHGKPGQVTLIKH